MERFLEVKYCDSNSVLLVNRLGALRKLFCPFQVRVLTNVNELTKGVVVWVEQVAANERNELIYSILGKPYHYTHFEITASF